jgi:poly-gamma-glutamate synthesis protein (capsule biosynthesis protein)
MTQSDRRLGWQLFWPFIAFAAGGCQSSSTSELPTAAHPETTSVVELAIAGQALLKLDPRGFLSAPFESVTPILNGADIAFTNFEMAVNPPGNGCGMPKDFVVIRGEPVIPPPLRPGNTLRPHAVSSSVMELLASMNFRLMSLVNNHSWDLGRCGILATIEAADSFAVTHAGTGRTTEEATAPAYIEVNGTTIALIAANTSDDEERHIVSNEINGIWLGYPEDVERNLAAIRDAAQHADFVMFYHHFQIEDSHLEGLTRGEANSYGHRWIEEGVSAWQTAFARAVIDAGASIYVGHGHRGFDGIEIYKGRPLIRQLGGFAYQGLLPELGAYDSHHAWSGLIASTRIENGRIRKIVWHPLELDEGRTYVDDVDLVTFMSRRGTSQLATGESAGKILRRFRHLSSSYGTDVVIDGETAWVDFGDAD